MNKAFENQNELLTAELDELRSQVQAQIRHDMVVFPTEDSEMNVTEIAAKLAVVEEKNSLLEDQLKISFNATNELREKCKQETNNLKLLVEKKMDVVRAIYNHIRDLNLSDTKTIVKNSSGKTEESKAEDSPAKQDEGAVAIVFTGEFTDKIEPKFEENPEEKRFAEEVIDTSQVINMTDVENNTTKEILESRDHNDWFSFFLSKLFA